MPARLSPVAIRAWARPAGWKPRRKRRPAGSWPQVAFLVATAARAAPGEPLRFGACALLPSLLPGQQPVDVRLFYPDDCPPEDQARLVAVAASRNLPTPLSRRELTALFYKRTYRQRLALVGYGLPAQLGRLAAGWRTSRKGGFSLILSTRPCPAGRRTPAEKRRHPLLQNGEIEDGDRPRITINPLPGLRGEIRFTSRGRPDPQDRAPDGEAGRPREGYAFPGFVVDLAVLASVQAAGERYPTAAAAADAFGVSSSGESGDSGEAACVETLLTELEQLAALYLRLLDCHRQTPGGALLPPDRVYSVGSYADAVLEAVGLDPPLDRDDLPERAHALGMGAFFGGDSGIAIRHEDLPVSYLDITGHYPVSAYLAGTFELLRATKLELVEEDPADLQRFLAGLSVERLLAQPQLWRRLGRSVCLIHPQGDLLPHRVPHGKSLLLKTAPLTSRDPLPYLLADLADTLLRTGLQPEITAAYSLRPTPRHRKRLRPTRLPSGHVFDPAHEDLFLTLAEERLRLQQHPSLSVGEQDRQASLLKLIVNAACYGLLCQVNVLATHGEVQVTRLDGTSSTLHLDTVEEPGPRSMPLLAAGVTATGRLLLHLARLLAEQAGLTVYNWDTDSLCATPAADGPTPRGEHHRQTSERVSALPSSELTRVQAELERISPYNPKLKPNPAEPLLLALEPENYDPETGHRLQLRLYATASKNYDLYTLSPDPPPTVRHVKWSEHGLGHLRTPGHPELDHRDWIAQGRHNLLNQQLRVPSPQPAWWDEPAISIITLNRPGELARLQATLSTSSPGTLLRPFSQLAVAHALPLYARSGDGRRRTPVAPFHTGFDPHRAPWHDLATGQPLAVRYRTGEQLTEADLTSTATDERVLCDTIGAALERNSRRPEAKALDATGNPCTHTTTGILQPAPTEAIRLLPIGKETRNLERAGITEDPSYTLYTDPERDAWREIFLPTLRKLAPGLIPPGRPSRHQRGQLAHHAGELARAAVHGDGDSLQADPERACYLYLKSLDERTCSCGCGEAVNGRATYVDGAHRMRAHRRRRQQAAPTLPNG